MNVDTTCATLVQRSKNETTLQAIEKNGGDDGTRTRGLCRDRRDVIACATRPQWFTGVLRGIARHGRASAVAFCATICATVFLSAPAFPQGVRYDNFVVKPLPAGGLQAVSGTLITVCTSSGSGTPCTPKVANIYSDEALTSPITGTGGAGTTNSDGNGNFGFWALPGTYKISITGSGITPQLLTVSLPAVLGPGSTMLASLISPSANPAASGFTRAASGDLRCWRNAANSSDLCLSKTAGDLLQWNNDTVATLTAAQTLANKTLTAPIIGSDVISAAPRMFFHGTSNGSALATGITYGQTVLDKAITVTRVTVSFQTAPSGCGTQATVQLTDGTTPITLTVVNLQAVDDSGSIAQNYAAGATLKWQVGTAPAGCAVNPFNDFFTAEYRMQ